MEQEFDETKLYDYEAVRDYLTLRLLGKFDERNNDETLLLMLTPFMDLKYAAVIHRKVSDNEYATVYVTRDMVNDWGKDESRVWYEAFKNFYDNLNENSEICVRRIEDLLHRPTENENLKGKMFVVSNESGIYGASTIISPIIRDFLAKDMLNDDIIIIPSSVHEVIVVPATGADLEQINSLVATINYEEVVPRDVLSDHIYIQTKDGRVFTDYREYEMSENEY